MTEEEMVTSLKAPINNSFSSAPSYFSPVKEEKQEKIVTEMCDVCGGDIDYRLTCRSAFLINGVKFVFRHHSTCNPYFRVKLITQSYHK